MKTIMMAAALLFVASSTVGVAQTRPVATACKEDIPKLCAGLPHDGSVRRCLEAAKDKVSPGCKTALETTGWGRKR